MVIKVSHLQGGRLEFQETGIYPNFLIFNCENYNQEWRVRLENDLQEGSLLYNERIVYNYKYERGCQIQEVFENGSVSDWVRVRMTTIMVD